MFANDDMDFELFFKKYQDMVYKIVKSYVKSRDTTEDIVVESFLKLHSRWNKVRFFENKPGYLVRTAINTAKSYLIKNKILNVFDVNAFQVKAKQRNPEEMYFLSEENDQLEKELMGLKEIERNIIILKDIDGRKFDEISVIIKKKLSTVKSIYRRSKIKLSQRVEEAL